MDYIYFVFCFPRTFRSLIYFCESNVIALSQQQQCAASCYRLLRRASFSSVPDWSAANFRPLHSEDKNGTRKCKVSRKYFAVHLGWKREILLLSKNQGGSCRQIDVLVLLGRHVASGITAPSPSRCCSLHPPPIICSILFATGLTSVKIVKFK
jgi:hypothetical protein